MEATTNNPTSNAVQQLQDLLDKMTRMDYYQIIGSKPEADAREIKRRFYARSKRYHPDRYNYVNDPNFRKLVTKVYKQVSEAYNILKDPQARQEYDNALADDRAENLKFRPGDKNNKKKEFDGGDGPGAKYYRLAVQALASDNLAGARNNIKLALMMESGNEHFLALQKQIVEKE